FRRSSAGASALRRSVRAPPDDPPIGETSLDRAGTPALEGSYFPIFTSVTVFTRLFASTKSPSRVTDVLRTMLPPPGSCQLWNFVILGSKRTIVFGVVPDSLYQITSWIAEMPYGSDFGPLGEGHSVTLPVAGSRRPR